MADKLILITGITGNQGGAVARHLIGKGFKLRGMTRKPDSDKAKALAKQGVEIVKGDLNDSASVRAALKGVWGAFAVQNTWEAGVEGEENRATTSPRPRKKPACSTSCTVGGLRRTQNRHPALRKQVSCREHCSRPEV